MRILSIAHTPFRGGANISWLNTLKGLKGKGVELCVVAGQEDFLTERLRQLSIPYEVAPSYYCVYPIERKGILNKILFLPRLGYRLAVNVMFIKKIKRIAQEFKPDLIHTNGSVIDMGLSAAKSLGLPHVWHLREYTDLDFNYDLIPTKHRYFSKIRNESHSISITPDIYRHFGIREEGGVVIYNGIVDASKIYEPRPRKNRLIYVGEVTEGKGATDMIEAYAIYRGRGGTMPLEILGQYDADYRSTLEDILKKYGVKDGVIFHGQVDNVGDFLLESKAIVVPSKNEGFGRVTAEAMSLGCLVVGRNTGGTRLQFETGKKQTGHEIGIRFLTVTELAEKLMEVSEMNSELIDKITSRAKTVAIANYSAETNIEATYSYFKSILKQ